MKLTADALKGKKIGFLGLGKSNLALMDTLPLDGCEVVLRSDNKISLSDLPKKLRTYKIFDGARSLSDISEDILFLSPSARRDRREIKEAIEKGVKVSSDAEYFFENNVKPIYAVTGSDGKSTTATLISMLLGDGCALIGNIGVPMSFGLNSDNDAYVCELSSFMLSYTTPKTARACITNITPNHLDFHGTFEEYTKVKLSLLDFTDEAVVNFDDDILRDRASKKRIFGVTSSKHGFEYLRSLCHAEAYITYEKNAVYMNGEKILDIETVRQKQIHNIKNLMMAIAMTYGKASREKIIKVASEFEGLEHRCRLVGSFFGVDFYDSSIDSSPARTRSTLESLGRRAIVILGGRGKGLSYETLREPLKSFCHKAILYGEDADRIYSDIRGACPCVMVDCFDEAVEFAKELGKECGAVLLSPAATSYDEFKNYEERGNFFKKIIAKT